MGYERYDSITLRTYGTTPQIVRSTVIDRTTPTTRRIGKVLSARMAGKNRSKIVSTKEAAPTNT